MRTPADVIGLLLLVAIAGVFVAIIVVAVRLALTAKRLQTRVEALQNSPLRGEIERALADRARLEAAAAAIPALTMRGTLALAQIRRHISALLVTIRVVRTAVETFAGGVGTLRRH